MKVIAVVRPDLFANAKGEDAGGDAGSLEKGQDKNKRGAVVCNM